MTALALRPVLSRDAESVAALLARVGGPLTETAEQVRAELESIPSADAFLLEEGEAVAGIAAFRRRGALIADGRIAVLPGREAPLLEAVERRVAELGIPIVRLSTRPVALDLAPHGYAHVRTFLRLVAERALLAATPPSHDAIPVPVTDLELYALEEEGFAGHWAFISESYGDWHARVAWQGEVPAFVVREAGRPVGGVRCAQRHGRAWITSLVVAPEARGRGIGEALVRAAASAFDDAELGLEVDAANEPAVRLYRRVGFAEVDRKPFWEKELSA